MKKIETTLFKKFLKLQGLELKRIKGDHEIWDMKTGKGLSRPIIFRKNEKDIPVLHLHANLLTLEISHKDFEKIILKLK